jgi:hypothetical protein
MSREILEEIVKVFDRYEADWTDESKENEHRDIIKKVAEMKNLDELFFEFLDDEVLKIRMQIFLIFIESQNKELIKKFIEWIVIDYKRVNNYNIFFGYLSEESFFFFYNILKEIGLFRTDNYIRLSVTFLNYFVSKSDDRFIEDFYKIVINDNKFYFEVWDNIRFFSKAKELILEEYYKEDNKNLKYKEIENGDSIGWTFLLQQNETLAFKCLRNYDTLTNYRVNPKYSILHLILYGDKEDGQVILNAIDYGMKNGVLDKEGKKIFNLLENLLRAVTNPILINGLVKYFKLDNYRLKRVLHEMLYLQYRDVVDEELCGQIQYLLGGLNVYSKEILERRLNKREKVDRELISCEYLFNYWSKIIKEFSHLKTTQEKKSFYTGKAYNIKEELLAYSEEWVTLHSAQLEILIIYTGQYFPLDYTGYYSKIKAQLSVWEKYIDENIEKFEDGRWYRYGRYVD